jgi:hypothetical protein
MPPSALSRLRRLCLGLPEAREVIAWGEPTFRVKTIFAMYASPGSHHGAGRASVWVKALATNQELMIAADPERFFSPPYVGASGWIGVYLDARTTDWDELRELLWDAWRMSAPAKLVAQHSEPPRSRGEPRPQPPASSKNASTRRRAAAKRERHTRTR